MNLSLNLKIAFICWRLFLGAITTASVNSAFASRFNHKEDE